MRPPRLSVLTLILGLAACATPVERVQVPEPSRPVRTDRAEPIDRALIEGGASTAPTELRQTPTPTPPAMGRAISGLEAGGSEPGLVGEPISVGLESVPLPTFVNEVFGNLLGLNFQIDPALESKRDLVTLRVSEPQRPVDFYRLAVQVLRTYGVSVRYEDGLVRVYPSATGRSDEPPLVLSGRTLPDVPISHRPIFQLVELHSVRIADVNQWLRTAFKMEGLDIQDDPNRNAVVLYGKPDLVAQAVAAIRVLDRPFMRGRVSTRLEPAFVSAEELARQLVDVLVAEGYGALVHTRQGTIQGSTIIVLPIPSANTLLIFAADTALLDHAVEWARTIDRPNPVAGGESLFYYLVRNTRAEEIERTLSGVRGAAHDRGPVRTARSSVDVNAPGASREAEGTAAAVAAGLGTGRLLVDEPRNALIFQGPAAEWERLLPLVKQMDRAARQVMIEVTIAEVTLDDTEEFGVAWLAKHGFDRFSGRITSGQLGAAPFGSSGLNYLLDVAGETRVALNALATQNRVSVLSNPKLLVKSGEEASIDVSTEIPVLSSTTAAEQQTGGTSNILQTVEYRRTGVILNVRPVVYSDNRVDLEIRQEASNTLGILPGTEIPSPSFFNRSVSTSLTLRDGSSILIGGMMQEQRSAGNSGIPWLKNIPLLGHLFKTSNENKSKTELVVMIVPYIVESDTQALEVTRAVTDRLQTLQIPAAAAARGEPEQP